MVSIRSAGKKLRRKVHHPYSHKLEGKVRRHMRKLSVKRFVVFLSALSVIVSAGSANAMSKQVKEKAEKLVHNAQVVKSVVDDTLGDSDYEVSKENLDKFVSAEPKLASTFGKVSLDISELIDYLDKDYEAEIQKEKPDFEKILNDLKWLKGLTDLCGLTDISKEVVKLEKKCEAEITQRNEKKKEEEKVKANEKSEEIRRGRAIDYVFDKKDGVYYKKRTMGAYLYIKVSIDTDKFAESGKYVVNSSYLTLISKSKYNVGNAYKGEVIFEGEVTKKNKPYKVYIFELPYEE